MAPLPVISNVYRVAFEWTNSDTGLTATNVMHFHAAGSNPLALITALDAHVTASMWLLQTTHSHIANLIVTPLDGGGVSVPFATGSPAKWTGEQTNEEFSPQVAGIIKLLTAKRGRSYRGRVYLPWVAETSQTNGQLSTGSTASLDTSWIAFHTAMTTAGFDWVVASYKLATAENVVAVGAELYTGTIRKRNARNSSTP